MEGPRPLSARRSCHVAVESRGIQCTEIPGNKPNDEASVEAEALRTTGNGRPKTSPEIADYRFRVMKQKRL